MRAPVNVTGDVGADKQYRMITEAVQLMRGCYIFENAFSKNIRNLLGDVYCGVRLQICFRHSFILLGVKDAQKARNSYPGYRWGW